jgi:hypothetical protein
MAVWADLAHLMFTKTLLLIFVYSYLQIGRADTYDIDYKSSYHINPGIRFSTRVMSLGFLDWTLAQEPNKRRAHSPEINFGILPIITCSLHVFNKTVCANNIIKCITMFVQLFQFFECIDALSYHTFLLSQCTQQSLSLIKSFHDISYLYGLTGVVTKGYHSGVVCVCGPHLDAG